MFIKCSTGDNWRVENLEFSQFQEGFPNSLTSLSPQNEKDVTITAKSVLMQNDLRTKILRKKTIPRV